MTFNEESVTKRQPRPRLGEKVLLDRMWMVEDVMADPAKHHGHHMAQIEVVIGAK